MGHVPTLPTSLADRREAKGGCKCRGEQSPGPAGEPPADRGRTGREESLAGPCALLLTMDDVPGLPSLPTPEQLASEALDAVAPGQALTLALMSYAQRLAVVEDKAAQLPEALARLDQLEAQIGPDRGRGSPRRARR